MKRAIATLAFALALVGQVQAQSFMRQAPVAAFAPQAVAIKSPCVICCDLPECGVFLVAEESPKPPPATRSAASRRNLVVRAHLIASVPGPPKKPSLAMLCRWLD